MPGSTYSTNLKIELMSLGDQSGTWGTTTNTNLGTALEQAIVGYGNPNFATDANTSISLTDSNASQTARAFVLNVTSSVSLTATRELVVPTVQKPYIIRNNTSGGQSITVKTTAGTGVTVPTGSYVFVYGNGTDVVSAIDHIPTLTLATALAAASGGTGQSSYAVGDLLYASTTTALSKLADVATGNALISGGVSTAPAWGKIGLTTHVSGTLPVANGGTNQTSYTDGQLLIGNSTGNTLTKATLTAGTGITITNGSGAITIAGNTGTVTSVSGTGTVNGITLTGTVTSSGSLTLGGALSGVSLTTQVTGTLPVANGGTGTTTSTGSGAVVLASGPTVTLANATGLPLTTGVTGTLPVANGGTGAATLTANNVLLGNGTSAVQAVAPGTSGNVLQSNGATWTSTAKLTLETAQATTSGVSREYTGIPSWVKRITMLFSDVSTNGSSNLVVQVGSTTYTTSGYDSVLLAINGASIGTAAATDGFLICTVPSTSSVSGSIVITLLGSNTWVATVSNRYAAIAAQSSAGRVVLSGTLDRIKLLTSNGTDVLNAGTINIIYE
jgi:hypothetical protein